MMAVGSGGGGDGGVNIHFRKSPQLMMYLCVYVNICAFMLE